MKSAKQPGKTGRRPRIISPEKMQAISEALKSGTSKAAICRIFNVKRTILYDNLDTTDNDPQDQA